MVRAGPQGTYLVPRWALPPAPHPKHSALAGLPSLSVTTNPKSPPALKRPSPWPPMWAEEKPLRVLRPDESARRGMELTTACRYFSCSKLLESAWDWPGGGGGEAELQRAAGPGLDSPQDRAGTWRRRVLGLEEADHALAVQAPGAQQHGPGAPAAPADHGEAVLAVAAGHTLQGVVLDALGDDQQTRVAVNRRRGVSRLAGAHGPCERTPHAHRSRAVPRLAAS